MPHESDYLNFHSTLITYKTTTTTKNKNLNVGLMELILSTNNTWKEAELRNI